jgi:hypothetical protein
LLSPPVLEKYAKTFGQSDRDDRLLAQAVTARGEDPIGPVIRGGPVENRPGCRTDARCVKTGGSPEKVERARRMRPFDFVITFMAFVYALALAHVLLAATHMIRHRRELVFDWAHALWMLAALMMLWANWISLWDLHGLNTLKLPTVATGFLFSILLYAICAFVSPKLDAEDGMNMKLFHETQSRTYVGAFVVTFACALPVNFFATTSLNIATWANQNSIVIAMLLASIAPLIFRARWVQIATPIALIALLADYMVRFYWVLR